MSIPVHSDPSRSEICAREVPGWTTNTRCHGNGRDLAQVEHIAVVGRLGDPLRDRLGQQVVGLQVVLVAREEDGEPEHDDEEHERARDQRENPPHPHTHVT